MPELRWALIGLGAVFIAGLALWEWRRSRRGLARNRAELMAAAGGASHEAAAEDWPRRVEPRIDSLLAAHGVGVGAERTGLREVPVIHPTEPLAVPVSRDAAVDLPAAAARSAPVASKPAIRWPPERADRVLNLRLVGAQGAPLPGREVRLALEQAGLVHGPQGIFHRTDTQGAVLVSAANMMRPGDLDPLAMDEQQLRGLSLFSVLPGPLPPVRMLEELVGTARSVAWRLGVGVQDEQGAELDGDVLMKLRQSLPDAVDEGAA